MLLTHNVFFNVHLEPSQLESDQYIDILNHHVMVNPGFIMHRFNYIVGPFSRRKLDIYSRYSWWSVIKGTWHFPNHSANTSSIASRGCMDAPMILQHLHQFPEAGIKLKEWGIGLLQSEASIEAHCNHDKQHHPEKNKTWSMFGHSKGIPSVLTC